VGKSSLINALTGSDRSIVSDIPGTTRDYISAFLMVGPWRIEILDTAGLHEAGDAIEQIGINHTIEQAETADFFLLMLDATAPSPALPESLLDRMTPKNTIVIENKIDLPNAFEHHDFMPEFKHARLSLQAHEGLPAFRKLWKDSIESAVQQPNATDGVVVNARHASALGEACDSLELAAQKMKDDDLSELIASDLRAAVEAIGKVVGKVDNDRMLDSLFKQFCIGK
jgi:tRNA modification GTPase